MDEAERLADRVAIVDHGRVIAHGTPRALIGSLGAEHVVEFALADGGRRERTVLDDATLTMIAGVRAARRAGDGYALQVTHLHETMPALIAELERRSLTLDELRTHTATLEDVFVALTGRQLRDA
jgi:ABC-2 type transport system ATP-binding protein